MILIAPFLLQGLLMGVDEFYCHRRRELRRWERIGHPVDTFVFASCFLPLLFLERELAVQVFVPLALLSCLLITKDEWQHRELCSGFENWLHAMLFIIHPVVLICTYWLWAQQATDFALVTGLVLSGSVLLGLYQAAYWNLSAAVRTAPQLRRATQSNSLRPGPTSAKVRTPS